MYRAILTAAAIVWGMSATADAQVKLQFKFPDSSSTTSTVATKTHQILTVAAMDLETNVSQTVVTTSKTGKRQADGTIQLTSQVGALKANLELPGGVELNFDSAKPSEPQGTAADFLLEVFAAIPKVVSTTVLGQDNRAVSVTVDEKPLEDLSDAAKAVLKGRFEPDYLKDATNKGFDKIPTSAIEKGDTWQVTQTVLLGGGQSLTFTVNYKYEGTIDKDGKTLDKISATATEVEYALDDPNAAVKVTASKLKVDSSVGAILFDRKLGRVVFANDKLHVTGEMTLDANGTELPAKLDLTIETKATVK